MRRLTPHAHSIIAPAFLSGYIVKYVPPPRGTLNASGTSVELLKVMVATPRPVKMLAGRLPVAVFIPMTTGKGPVPLGVLIVALNVIDVEPCVETTVSLPPEKVAVRLVGGAPLGPDTQYSTSALDLGAPASPLVLRGDPRAVGHQERVGQVRDRRQRAEGGRRGRRRAVRARVLLVVAARQSAGSGCAAAAGARSSSCRPSPPGCRRCPRWIRHGPRCRIRRCRSRRPLSAAAAAAAVAGVAAACRTAAPRGARATTLPGRASAGARRSVSGRAGRRAAVAARRAGLPGSPGHARSRGACRSGHARATRRSGRAGRASGPCPLASASLRRRRQRREAPRSTSARELLADMGSSLLATELATRSIPLTGSADGDIGHLTVRSP